MIIGGCYYGVNPYGASWKCGLVAELAEEALEFSFLLGVPQLKRECASKSKLKVVFILPWNVTQYGSWRGLYEFGTGPLREWPVLSSARSQYPHDQTSISICK